jgi:hypothetical protein
MMKYTIALLLGVISSINATENKQLQRLNTNTGTFAEGSEDEETLVQWTDEFGPGETGIIDALTKQEPHCDERLWLDPREVEWQLDMFSRTCNLQHYKNAQFILLEIGGELPKAKSWELLDAAFSFERIRRYDFVEDNMNMLEHFQDNFNQNRQNSVNAANFARVCATVQENFATKFHNGEFDAPRNHDPRQEALDKHNA